MPVHGGCPLLGLPPESYTGVAWAEKNVGYQENGDDGRPRHHYKKGNNPTARWGIKISV